MAAGRGFARLCLFPAWAGLALAVASSAPATGQAGTLAAVKGGAPFGVKGGAGGYAPGGMEGGASTVPAATAGGAPTGTPIAAPAGTPAGAHVSAEARTALESQLDTAARAYLERELAGKFAAYELALAQGPRGIRLPDGVRTVTVRPGQSGAPAARMPVWLDVAVDGRAAGSALLVYALRVTQTVAVARGALGAGTALDGAAIGTVLREIAAPDPCAVAPELLRQPYRLRRAVRDGEVICHRHLAPADQVLKDEVVTLRLRSGGFDIETRAVAQQEGAAGQWITVRPANSTGAVAARVVAAGVVEAEEK
jgi:flagella basal body P-ring formation protein FlgA